MLEKVEKLGGGEEFVKVQLIFKWKSFRFTRLEHLYNNILL